MPKKKPGRKISECSLNLEAEQIPNKLIKQYIRDIVTGDGFPYGYKKINATLKEDYQLAINHKKTYRLCKELNVLRPQRKVYPNCPRNLAKREEVTAPNQHWQMDLKYGYIEGMDRFFFQLSLAKYTRPSLQDLEYAVEKLAWE